MRVLSHVASINQARPVSTRSALVALCSVASIFSLRGGGEGGSNAALDGGATTQGAFVFAKPHANTPEVQELIRGKFAEVGVTIEQEGEIAGEAIDANGYIDQHYRFRFGTC